MTRLRTMRPNGPRATRPVIQDSCTQQARAWAPHSCTQRRNPLSAAAHVSGCSFEPRLHANSHANVHNTCVSFMSTKSASVRIIFVSGPSSASLALIPSSQPADKRRTRRVNVGVPCRVLRRRLPPDPELAERIECTTRPSTTWIYIALLRLFWGGGEASGENRVTKSDREYFFSEHCHNSPTLRVHPCGSGVFLRARSARYTAFFSSKYRQGEQTV